MKDFNINGAVLKAPADFEAAISLLRTVTKKHAALVETAHFFALESGGSAETISAASMLEFEEAGVVALLFEILGSPKFAEPGFCRGTLSDSMAACLKACLSPLLNNVQSNFFSSFSALMPVTAPITFAIYNRQAGAPKHRNAFLELKTEALFGLFNQGALRGSDTLARQALLDSFTVLPNRFLTSSGAFLDSSVNTSLAAGIDKFPSLLSKRAEELKRDSNRIVPGAMLRNGVYVGKRNIFMFHSAVNLAAYIADDNLIDSHASIGSAAQIGSKNKIASFVSLEGVLSPANAEGVSVGNENFLGTFVRIGTGMHLGDQNFIGSGVNLSLGTKIRDCRESSGSKGQYLTCRELNKNFNQLAILPNNAKREFNGVELLPGEIILIENTEEFKARFDGDKRIQADS